MKSLKLLLLSTFLIMSLFLGKAFADTCYTPYGGYYECDPEYYTYEPQDYVGVVIGGGWGYYGGGYGYGHGGGNWHGGHGGPHHGGGGGHGGGHHR